MEKIPMRSVLMTEFGEYEVPPSVAAKIERFPKKRHWSPYTEELIEWQPMTGPVLARYYRLVQRHMQRQWLAEDVGAAA
jgi:hypothetical protein